ncbi:hypothetical protein ACPUYX_13095 [Desulfosporosinus sp. SYSU MS00001]|uniref:hypothetical protein n=1 Tax=Desulfosporosinus sp. SYSU MS00001 TaxID=3416284 RepID=UPI003CF21A63
MKIPRTKDRMLLGILAGSISFIIQSVFDYTSTKKGFSKRSYWTTAAGVWVNSRRQAKKWDGQLLGAWMTFGLNVMNGIFMVWAFTKVSLNKWPLKGAVLGSAFGATVNALLSGFENNKVAPKDGTSNLSYALTNILTGLVSASVIVNVGDKSIFNEKRAMANNMNAIMVESPHYIDGSSNRDVHPIIQ